MLRALVTAKCCFSIKAWLKDHIHDAQPCTLQDFPLCIPLMSTQEAEWSSNLPRSQSTAPG